MHLMSLLSRQSLGAYYDSKSHEGIGIILMSFQSTPADSISPTVLLSPVLSRPVRSQSAHTSTFLRTATVASDSDSENPNGGSRPGSGVWSHTVLYRQGSRASRTSRIPSESSSPLATPPINCSSPRGSPSGKYFVCVSTLTAHF